MMILPGNEPSEAVVARLLWREQIQALPRAIWSALRRLARREPRWYLVVDGQVIARLTASEDHDALLRWITFVHGETFRTGVKWGREVESAVNGSQADAGDAGPA